MWSGVVLNAWSSKGIKIPFNLKQNKQNNKQNKQKQTKQTKQTNKNVTPQLLQETTMKLNKILNTNKT